ncbi:MAG TPA: immunoglobulin domain-containing protein [Opitutus sp.]|nr:immunoglobulin domain-containing protein [Opitutus sp.]
MKLSQSFHRRLHWINLPTTLLVALLQRTPVARVVTGAGEFVMSSPLGAVLKSSVAAFASLGAVHSLAGATQLSTTAPSPFSATVGAAVTIGFSITGTLSEPETWTVGGSVPPGLTFNDGQTSGTIAGGTLVLSGTPTTAGSYSFSLSATDTPTGNSTPNYNYTVNVTGAAAVAPAITMQPQSASGPAGSHLMLMAAASGTPAPAFQWQRNGSAVSGGADGTLMIDNTQPEHTGIYRVVATNSGGSSTSAPAILGVTTTAKVIGEGTELQPANIVHPNGNVFDQVLLTGVAEAITADVAQRQVTRTSYIDLDDDIVQVEFSGPGTLSLVLDGSSAPAAPTRYNQPSVSYMKGHAGIVITGATEQTNVSVFTVGRATAFDPTGTYNILLEPSATNVPASNGSSLFVGHQATSYDGIADIAFIAIASANGQFGGIRTSNAHYFAAKGFTGVYAPGVTFNGPLFIGDVTASDDASPVIVVGAVTDSRITGGDLAQVNGKPVEVSGLTQLRFTGGGDSHGNGLTAQQNQAVLMSNGQNVTAQVVVNP